MHSGSCNNLSGHIEIQFQAAISDCSITVYKILRGRDQREKCALMP